MATKKLTGLYPAPDAYAEADTKNPHGAPSFTHGLEARVLRCLTTGTLEDTFYADAKAQAKDNLGVFTQMAQKDAELFAKMIVYARTEGLLRSVPITALVVLSKFNPALFRLIFRRVVNTPNDLRDFVALVRTGSIRKGLGRAVMAAVNDWLNNMSEYHAIKYGSSGNDFSLKDIMRLTHPNPVDQKHEVMFNYLVKGLDSENSSRVHTNLPQIWSMEALKRAESSETQRQLIRDGRLPYEVVVGCIKPDVPTWVELMGQMPFFALLRHINTLNKHGVFNDPQNVTYVVGILRDKKRVQNSKVLPFRFFTAYNTLDASVPRPIQEAVVDALELSFDNMPQLPGRIAVGSDVSGSMGSCISGKGKTRYIDICGIFTAAVMRKSTDAVILPFDDDVHLNFRSSSRDTMMSIARTLASYGGGGTAVGAPAAYLHSKRIKVDTFIGITDNMDWAAVRGWGGGQGFTNIWQQYRKDINPNAEAFLLTISPYSHWMSKESTPGIHYIYGWSDAVPEYISKMITGQGNQMDAVRAIDLFGSGGVREDED